MSNLTSRQVAIDAEGLDAQIRCEMCRNPMHTDRGCDGNCKYDEKLYERIMQILDERIRPLPPAQPEQRWIPCSERLPDKYGNYLVTTDDGEVDIGSCDPENKDRQDHFWSGCDADGFFWYGENIVIAWMSLPEPARLKDEQ